MNSLRDLDCFNVQSNSWINKKRQSLYITCHVCEWNEFVILIFLLCHTKVAYLVKCSPLPSHELFSMNIINSIPLSPCVKLSSCMWFMHVGTFVPKFGMTKMDCQGITLPHPPPLINPPPHHVLALTYHWPTCKWVEMTMGITCSWLVKLFYNSIYVNFIYSQ